MGLAFDGRSDHQSAGRQKKRAQDEGVGPNPTDRAKAGTKRSLLTDGAGIPVGLAIDGANRNDHRLMEQTLTCLPVARPQPTEEAPQGLCLDKGYDYDSVRELAAEFGFTLHLHPPSSPSIFTLHLRTPSSHSIFALHLRTRGEEMQAIKKEAGHKARRWVVERTHSWMNRSRRLLIRWEKKAVNYLGFLHLVCAYITYKRMGLLG